MQLVSTNDTPAPSTAKCRPVLVPQAVRPAPGSPERLFWADDAEVAAFTHDVDTDRESVEPSVWVALPIGRDVLIAACMTSPTADADELVAMTSAQVRSWALGNLLFDGGNLVKRELEAAWFATGYRSESADAASFFALVCARLDEAFGFASRRPQLDPTRVVRRRTTRRGSRGAGVSV